MPGRRANYADEAPGLFREVVHMLLFIPLDVACHQTGGPGKLKPWFERGSDSHRKDAFDIEQHDQARFINWSVNDLPHCKSGMRVSKDGRFRAHLDSNSQFRGAKLQRIVFDAKRQLKIIEQFQRVDPGLKRSVLVTKDAGLVTHHIEEATGLCAPLK